MHPSPAKWGRRNPLAPSPQLSLLSGVLAEPDVALIDKWLGEPGINEPRAGIYLLGVQRDSRSTSGPFADSPGKASDVGRRRRDMAQQDPDQNRRELVRIAATGAQLP